ncbi:MAG: hypothetical protein EON85_00980 [Brevundimonas sp.]|nr:MAG: hypothetical protein EON85_00980 [Brevundimonas sp.]
MIATTGTAQIQHAETGIIYEIDAGELDWNADGGEERQMGTERRYVADLEHDDLGSLVWEVHEYPVGALNHRATDAGKHKVVRDFDLALIDDGQV